MVEFLILLHMAEFRSPGVSNNMAMKSIKLIYFQGNGSNFRHNTNKHFCLAGTLLQENKQVNALPTLFLNQCKQTFCTLTVRFDIYVDVR